MTVPIRLVLADNDSDALDLLVTDLGLEGHTIVGACRQGDEAVTLCQALRPDVLVLDFRMPPGPDGVAVLRALRGQEGLRIIVYTNYTQVSLRRRVEALGAEFLVKGHLAALRSAVLGAA